MKLIKLLCIFLFLHGSLSQSTCQEFMQNMMDVYESQGTGLLEQKIPQETILYSGKQINDLGQFDSCLEIGFAYSLAVIKSSVPIRLLIGVCLPSYCQASDLQQYSPQATDFLNALLFPESNIIDTVQFVNPNEVYPEFGVLGGFVLAVTIMILLLAVIGSCVSFKEQGMLSLQYLNSGTIERKTDMVEAPKKHKSVAIQVLMCFSLYDNFKKLIKITKQKPEDDNFRMFNGIRVFSISWVIYGHQYYLEGFNEVNPLSADLVSLRQGVLLTLVYSGLFAVDVFFFIGGFLTSTLVVEKLRKMKNLRWGIIPGFYVHRLIRLWPTYMFFLFVYWQLLPQLGKGPLWRYFVAQTNICNTMWWTNFLLIDNLVNHTNSNGPDQYCFEIGWYMANDVQIFLTAPPLLILYIKRPALGKFFSWIFFIGCLIASFLVFQIQKFHIPLPDPEASPQLNFMDDYYFMPWVRGAPYYMGLIFGFMYLEWKSQEPGVLVSSAEIIKKSIPIRILMIIVGTLCIVWSIAAVIAIKRDIDNWNQVEQSLYETFGRIVFIIGTAILMIPGLIKAKNDPVNYMYYIITHIVSLSQDVFIPLARVSFCVYLVHFSMMQTFTYESRQMFYVQPSSPSESVPAAVLYAFIGGACLSLLVEVPFMNFEKIQFKAPRSSAPKKDSEKSEIKQELQQLEVKQ